VVTSTNSLSNSLKVDDKGRVTFSGLGSGIDFDTAVENIITARRIPVDRLQTKIDTNATKITAYQDLRVVLNAFQDSLATLRGAVSFDNTSNAFAAKLPYASVSRTDGATASSASSLVGVTVSNSAQAESHDIEILQVARAHKIASNSYSSTSTALGLTDSNTFSIEGTTITVSSQDTLLTLRDRINAANTGSNATGVSASIVTVSATENYLVLSKSTAGSDITISNTSGTPLTTVGILSGGVPAHELQASQKAQLYADGLLDSTNTTYETARLASASTTIGSSGTLRFNDGTTTRDLAYTSGQSITTLAANINADATLQTMGISASVVQEGAQYRLKIVASGDAFTITEQAAGTAIADLEIGNSRLLVERNTNTVSDLITGVTLSLFQAEVGTNVHIDIEKDLAAMKSKITAFVDAYNAVKEYINGQASIDPTTGEVSETAVLYGSRTLSDIEAQLGQILGIGTQGVSEAFSVLAQIGIEFVDNGTLSDPLKADTLKIDSSKLDNALLNNSDDVKRLFAFDFSSSDPRVTLLSFTSNTAYDASGYVLNVAFAELYESTAQSESGSITLTQAQTGGPASNGLSAITLSDTIATNHALRYAYNSSTEVLTLYDLTAGTSESVDITASLDALVGAGLDLGAGQTLDVTFSSMGTITLSGDNGFLRGTNVSDGTPSARR
jgi:flagellar hook-associated protein 2